MQKKYFSYIILLLTTFYSIHSYSNTHCPQQIVCSSDDLLDSCNLIGTNELFWDNKFIPQSKIYSGTYIFHSASTKCLHSGKTKCIYDLYDTVECEYNLLDKTRPSRIVLYNNINFMPEVIYEGSNWKKIWSSSVNGKGSHDICQAEDPLLCALSTKRGFLVYFYPENSKVKRVDIASSRGVLPGHSSYLLLDNFRMAAEIASQGIISILITVPNPKANGKDYVIEIGKINLDLNRNTSSINQAQLRPEYKIETDPTFSNTYRVIKIK